MEILRISSRERGTFHQGPGSSISAVTASDIARVANQSVTIHWMP